jgi:hypothetical protein
MGTILLSNLKILKAQLETSDLLLFSAVLCATDTVTALSLVKVN